MDPHPQLLESLRRAKHVVVLTGAGVSAESGLATFRDKQSGLWEKFDALELATPAAFAKDPPLVWGWYEWRRAAVLRAQPNGAHKAIADMANAVPRLTLVTQNVDDLHERAGSPSVLHLHGQLAHPYCEHCRRGYEFRSAEMSNLPQEGYRMEPPRCESCGGRVRPGVVWFGEPLPAAEWHAALGAAEAADVFFCVGTSSTVQPAASLTDIAIEAGALTVQINPNATEVDAKVAFAYRAPAGEMLPQIVRRAWSKG